MITSSDSHVVELPAIFAQFWPRRHRSLAPVMLNLPNGIEAIHLPGSARVLPVSEIAVNARRFSDLPYGAFDATIRVAEQEMLGVDAELLFPTLGLMSAHHVDPWYVETFAVAYNAWLAESWNDGSCARLALGGVGDAGLLESAVDYAVKHSFAGIVLPSEPRDGFWTDPIYYRAFHSLSDAGLLVAMHVFMNSRRPSAAQEATSFLRQVFIDGMYLRFPNLRFLIAEAGSTWLLSWLNRQSGIIQAACSERLRVAVDTVSLGDQCLPLVWGGDYPHVSAYRFSERLKSARRFAAARREDGRLFDGQFWLVQG